MDPTDMKYKVKVFRHEVLAELPETYQLSEEQRKFYGDNGYLVIKGLIDFTTLYACKQRFIQICKGQVEKGGITLVKEPALAAAGAKGEDLVNKLQDILYDDVFAQYFESARLLHVVKQIVGAAANGPAEQYEDNLTAMHSMFINKPPGTGRHPPHQDLYYFPFRPAEKIVASWTAVDDVTVENGCLYVVPGSQRPRALHAHGNRQDSNKMYHGILSEDRVAPPHKRVDLEMAPGDTVFFHPLLVHGSRPNGSRRHRKAISCHYANSACRYVEVGGTVQEGICEEISAEARRRGMDGSIQEIWHLRSKQVMGVKCNL